MPKLNHLRCFVMVAESQSVSVAARRLHRSPSAISMTLSNLEDELNRPLFESEGKSRLTPFGEYVFAIASEQISRFDRDIENIRSYASNGFGRVEIAAVPSFASHYLPNLLARFGASYPQITLAIRDDSSEQINRLIEMGEIDIGIASPKRGSNDAIDCKPILSDPIGVVCSSNHPLTRLDRPLVWQDLEETNFIANGTCRQIEDPDFQQIIETADIDVRNTTSILAMVAANIGVTTLPRLAIPEERKDVVFLTTTYENLHRDICVLTSSERSLSPACEVFVETLLEIS